MKSYFVDTSAIVAYKNTTTAFRNPSSLYFPLLKITGSKMENEYQKRLHIALNFIETNLAEDIKLEDIAKAASFSPFHFHRIFSAIMEETPGEYLRRIRLEKAAALLLSQPEYSITEIALETGFSSPSVFARAFQKHFKVSANDFRNKRSSNGSVLNIIKEKPALDLKNYSQKYQLQEIRKLPALRLACVRCRDGYGPQIEKAWGSLFSWAFPKGVVGPNTRFYGIPLDDPEITSADKCRYFASLTIADDLIPGGLIEIMSLQEGWYAVFPFRGEMSEITSFYKYIYGHWLPESNYLPDDRPTLEEYQMQSFSPNASNKAAKILDYSLLLPLKAI